MPRGEHRVLCSAMAGRGHLFQPGQSGNPGGRTRGHGLGIDALATSIRERYGADAAAIREELHKLATGAKTPAAVKLGAWRELLDRGWGKAPQQVEVLGDTGPVTVRLVWSDGPDGQG